MEWLERLGENTVAELVGIGALRLATGKDLDEFLGRFDFGSGPQEYELRFDGARIIADPTGGGDAVVDPAVTVYEAVPKKLAEVIAAANEFGVTELPGPGGESVYVLERILDPDDKIVVRVVLVLDEEWLSRVGAEEWVYKIAKATKMFALLRDLGGQFPWNFDRVTSVRPIPSAASRWFIDSRFYCDPRANIASEVLARVCKNVKFVYDGVNRKLFVHGEKLGLPPNNRPFKYIVGALKLGSSPIAEDEFARLHLELPNITDAEVRKARMGGKTAISKALKTKPHLIAETQAALVPEPPPGMIVSTVREDEVLWLPLQEW